MTDLRPEPCRADSAFLAAVRSRDRHGGQGCASTTLRSGQLGFTLVELVLVIALAGVVAVMISAVLSRPLQGFVDQSRRAELTDQAATALQRMARDIRMAVPNSVRSADPLRLELIPIAAAGRYEAGPEDPPACLQLGMDCEIEVDSVVPDAATQPHWLIVYNTQAPSYDAEPSGDGVISPKKFTWGGNTLEAELKAFTFKYPSPQRRFFLANEVVRYRCKGVTAAGGGTLLRETFDTLDLRGTPKSSIPLANAVSGCEFTYKNGTHARNALVTLRLSLSKGGETISLVQQVHVDNAP